MLLHGLLLKNSFFDESFDLVVFNIPFHVDKQRQCFLLDFPNMLFRAHQVNFFSQFVVANDQMINSLIEMMTVNIVKISVFTT